jgi:hypothetical protein
LYEKNPFKDDIEKLIKQGVFQPQTAKAKFADLKLINNAKTNTVVLDTKPEEPVKIEEKQIEEPQVAQEESFVTNEMVLENKQNKKKRKSFVVKLEQWIKIYPFLSVIISALLSIGIVKGIDVIAKFIWKIIEMYYLKN